MTAHHGAALAHARTTEPTSVGTVAIVGLGYVGLPTALSLHQAGGAVVGVDISAARIRRHPARRRRSHGIRPRAARPGDRRPGPVRAHRHAGRDRRGRRRHRVRADPVDDHHGPDLRAARGGLRDRVAHARRGQDDHPDLDHLRRHDPRPAGDAATRRGLEVGARHLRRLLARAHRPGQRRHPQEHVPRVLGGVSRPARSAPSRDRPRRARDARRLLAGGGRDDQALENIFRAVNISLANELADGCRDARPRRAR